MKEKGKKKERKRKEKGKKNERKREERVMSMGISSWIALI